VPQSKQTHVRPDSPEKSTAPAHPSDPPRQEASAAAVAGARSRLPWPKASGRNPFARRMDIPVRLWLTDRNVHPTSW